LKKIIFLFLIITNQLNSQNLENVDQIVSSYPSYNSVEDLAIRINNDFTTEIEKVKAIYTWLATNINYKDTIGFVVTPPNFKVYTDLDDMKRRLEKEHNKLVIKTLKTKKAICKGYALTFKKVCDILNIKNELIKGYVKVNPHKIAHIPKEKNHVWNLVTIKNRSIILDVTFGSGFSNNGKWETKLDNFYFDIKKEDINLTHYPSEKKWLKFMNQKSLRQFCEKPIFSKPFFITNATLISPVLGEIRVDKNQKIQLKLKNIEPSTILVYRYEAHKKFKKAKTVFKNNLTSLIIDAPKKDDNLKIYFNGELALQYKVAIY
jgi:transglutaminase/protease-like cytokinesis protein 3